PVRRKRSPTVRAETSPSVPPAAAGGSRVTLSLQYYLTHRRASGLTYLRIAAPAAPRTRPPPHGQASPAARGAPWLRCGPSERTRCPSPCGTPSSRTWRTVRGARGPPRGAPRCRRRSTGPRRADSARPRPAAAATTAGIPRPRTTPRTGRPTCRTAAARRSRRAATRTAVRGAPSRTRRTSGRAGREAPAVPCSPGRSGPGPRRHRTRRHDEAEPDAPAQGPRSRRCRRCRGRMGDRCPCIARADALAVAAGTPRGRPALPSLPRQHAHAIAIRSLPADVREAPRAMAETTLKGHSATGRRRGRAPTGGGGRPSPHGLLLGEARRATGGPGVHVAEQQGVRRAVGRGRHHADADGVHWGRVAARGGDGASRAEPAARRPQLRLRAAAVHEECPAEERVRCRGRHFRRGRGRLVRAAGRARARRLPAGPRAGVRAGGHLRRPGRAGGAARRRARGRAAYLSRDGVRIEGGVRRLQLGVLLRGSAVSSAARAERVRQSAGPPPTSSFLPPLRSWSCRALCMVAWFPCKWSIGAPSATSCLDLPTGHCSAFETQLCRFSSAENLIMDGASPHMLDLWLPLRLKCCRLLCGMTLPMEIDAKVQARGHECAKIATMTSSRIAVDPSSRSRLTFSCSSYRRLLTEQLDRAFPRWGSHSPSFVEGLISQVRRDG
ncbi:unnamed protein product, partial [Prorocentrum cordatum]